MSSNNSNSTDQDEELARALQEQFKNEVENYASESAWSQINDIFTPPAGDNPSTRLSTPTRPVPSAPNHNKSSPDTVATQFSTPSGSPDNSIIANYLERNLFDTEDQDAALARRLEQEMRDEEIASQLAMAEETSANFAVRSTSNISGRSRDSFAESPSQTAPTRSKSPTICYHLIRLISAVIMIGSAAIVLLVAFGDNASPSLDPSNWIPGWPDDGTQGGTVGENNIWDMNGEYRGLNLQVVNNLKSDSDWNDHFRSSMMEWDNGNPDAVTIYIRKNASFDPNCRAVRKAMKVCNGNYGPTDWRGVNQILLQNDYIITSIAKMNDYYLEGTNRAQKQYTMCHELGHGLGLGHSDENFHNADLGNCMDYTERPQNNMHPDESNFKILEELYGNIDGTSVRVAKDTSTSQSTTSEVTSKQEKVRPGDRRTEDSLAEEEFQQYAKFMLDPIHTSAKGSDQHPLSHQGWRVLRKTENAEYHERDLGNGYTIRTSLLLV